MALHPTSAPEFDSILNSNTYLMVDFTATWCPPCRMIGPVFEKLAEQYSIPGHLAFAKVDVDEAREVAERYGITAMPTFMFFKEGQRVAVNGAAEIKGASPPGITAAAEKLGALAKARAEGAEGSA
ncbi:Thioredoxin-like protein [Escovopsis weberi]|uniref:Thioredoxin-like protein n=1 Tax=Escovopsis weberi TaxID=150374 RepID=A0A0N0RTQ3_ESCWE|nr:Thioredoxin-like protein [Escovopsis weberi]